MEVCLKIYDENNSYIIYFLIGAPAIDLNNNHKDENMNCAIPFLQ